MGFVLRVGLLFAIFASIPMHSSLPTNQHHHRATPIVKEVGMEGRNMVDIGIEMGETEG